MSHYYILDKNKKTVPATLMEWAKAFDRTENRIVGKTHIEGVEVSTVFLGMDCNWTHEGPRELFETMLFGIWSGPEYQERCATWEQALEMHERAIGYVKFAPIEYKKKPDPIGPADERGEEK